MIIKRVGVLSIAKISGIMYAAMGLLGGIFLFFFSLIATSLPLAGREFPAGISFIFGVGGIIFLPLFYGFMGFILGAFSAWIYNVIAGITGGIELDIEN